MVKRLQAKLRQDFPEFLELDALLNMASLTWQRYGISAGELSELEDIQKEMIWLKLQETLKD